MVWKPDYVTDAELREYVTRSSETVDDAYIAIAKTAASRAIDTHTHRQFGKVASPVERTYPAHWSWTRRRWVIEIDDLMDTTGLTIVNADGAEITGYHLEPRNAEPDGKPWETLVVDPTSAAKPTGHEYLVTIEAAWGWSAVPTTVKQAALLQGSRFMARRYSPFGVAGSPDQGSELRLLARLDPDVAVSLKSLIRWWAAR